MHVIRSDYCFDKQMYNIYYFETFGPTRKNGEDPRGWGISSYYSLQYTYEDALDRIKENLRDQSSIYMHHLGRDDFYRVMQLKK